MSDTSARIRTFLLVTLMVGMLGMMAELLLIGHRETVQQQIPLMMLGLGIGVAAWHAVAPGALTVRALQLTMQLFVLSGVLGVGLHYWGNVEFELEMYPGLSGLELAQKTLTGATPVLAPGSMALLGLVGLTHLYKHPLFNGVSSRSAARKVTHDSLGRANLPDHDAVAGHERQRSSR
jgi:hypothetical protein